MNKRAVQIIRVLCERAGWVTASTIAVTIGCSVRSVKSHIADLNSTYNDFIRSSRSGYQINDQSLAYSLLQGNVATIPQDSYERRVWLLTKLLISDHRLQMEALAEELCISYQTLKNFLNQLKPQLSIYELVLKTKNDNVYIQGAEKSKRDMLIDLIYEENPDLLSNSSLFNSFLPHVDINAVRGIVADALVSCQYHMDDYSLLHTILYLSITIERADPAPTLPQEDSLSFPESVPTHITAFFKLLREKIRLYFDVVLTSQDLHDLALLTTTRINDQGTQIEGVSPDVVKLIQRIQHRIKNVFSMDMSSSDSILRFALHLQNLLIRLENNVVLKNPQLFMIKNAYPFIYEIAVVMSEVISEQIGKSVPEDEIGYLSIYIGILFQEQKNFETKVRAALVCPVYSNMRTMLLNRLNAVFSESITFSALCSDAAELSEQKNYDFVITTIALSNPPAGKTVKYISTYPSSEDIIAINEEVIHQRILHMQDVYQRDLEHLFLDEFYFYDAPFRNDTEAISFLSTALFKKGYVNQDFEKLVLQREEICTSAFSNIAIPHPLKACSKKSTIAVAVQPNGVRWGQKNTVNLILMLSICEDDKLLFHDIFEFITEFILNSSNFIDLMRAKTNAQFKELMASFISMKLYN